MYSVRTIYNGDYEGRHMMYTHCKKCTWDSGDYGYNSGLFKLKEIKEWVFQKHSRWINDRWFKFKLFGYYWLKPNLKMVALCFYWSIENTILHRQGKRPYTYQEFIQNGGVCPVCGNDCRND